MSSTPPAAAAPEARVAASVESWKRKLLDLTKRNRALSFRVNKVSTVTVVDEHPAEVFRILHLRGGAMRFRPAPEPVPGSQAALPLPAPHAAAEAFEEDVDAGLGLDFTPYDPAAAPERHSDAWLQTASPAEALDRSLRRLEEQARLSIEEQGVNTLFLALGMLHYTEAEAPGQAFRAPLVLLPVELTRRSARTGYEVRASEDDPVVNPALAEYLRPKGIVLPSLPDAEVMADDYDLQRFLAETAAQVSGRVGWAVRIEVYLGLFSFQKFVMYKDLEANAPAAAAHRLVRQLVTRAGGPVVGLPDDVRAMELDEQYPPETTAQVVDADSSQLRAIAASARGHDLVIEGPPGTGKSQTITNLIAQALAAGQSVLFVAEKMAALEVVHERLVRAGLGEFCLEMHSTKANKRAVMRELAAALDASLQAVPTARVSTERLPEVRRTLTGYARAVHTPLGALGVSPFHAFGELGRVLGAPRARLDAAVDSVSRPQLDQAVRDLGDLAAAAIPVGAPAEHPWRDAHRTFYSEDDLETARERAADLSARIGEVRRLAAEAEAAFGLPAPATLAAAASAAELADVLRRSPGAPSAVLRDATWDQVPVEAAALLERGRETARLRERLAARLSADALERDHAEDAAYVERKASGFFGFLAFLDGRFRSIRRRWEGYRLPAFGGSLIDQAAEMRDVDRLRLWRAGLASSDARGRTLFGEHWRGEGSDWDALDAYARWVPEARAASAKSGAGERALDAAVRAAPDVAPLEALARAAAEARGALSRLREAVGWPEGYLDDVSPGTVAARADALATNAAKGPQWAAFEAARQAVTAGVAADLLPPAMTGELPFSSLVPAFQRAFWVKWLTGAVRERNALARFHALAHEERVAEFRRLDQLVLQENRAALVATLRERVQHRLREPAATEALPFLRREMARQRNLSPLRRTMQKAHAAVRAIKPCFLMSPLSVAQFLDGTAPGFDLVIFDEASQLPTEDAVGAILRGARLVVVGDPKQLPPTDFFAVASGQVTTPLDEEGNPLFEDSESVLEEFMGAGVPMSRLRWHYRSAHESLISFSNVSFYDSDLLTFPSVDTSTEESGLRFRHVPDGVYEGRGVNPVEARRVADAVVAFAREQTERKARGEAALSLGVGTFNLRQQVLIQDELERRRREDPSLEPFFAREEGEPFFVKNLENVQGDERDVIFLSVTYGKGPDGRLRHNFGPLNGQNGWRRLNVLTTRARRRMVVFSSMRGDEIAPAAGGSDGPRLLREFLLYAERGTLEGTEAAAPPAAESPFERDVMEELGRRGLTLVPRVGIAGYRVDMAVRDDAVPGRFVCGIECDGASYMAAETARDRDRLRHQVLELRGWTILRVWSADWFKDRQGQVERILRGVDEARTRVLAENEARETRLRTAPPSPPLPAEAATSAEDDDVTLPTAAEADLAAPSQPIPPPADASHAPPPVRPPLVLEPQEEAPPASAADALAFAASTPAPPPAQATPATYRRPRAAAYRVAPGEGKYAGQDLVAAPLGWLADAVTSVVRVESPVHEEEVLSRVAAMWGTRQGSRVEARLRDAVTEAERSDAVARRGAFLWDPRAGDGVPVRSRSGLRTPAERIAPEEYRAALLAVLADGHAFPRPQLVAEVRAVLGFSRTGPQLEQAIGAEVDALLAEGRLGEASAGIRLRA